VLLLFADPTRRSLRPLSASPLTWLSYVSRYLAVMWCLILTLFHSCVLSTTSITQIHIIVKMAHHRMTAKTKSSPMSWLLLVLQFSAVCLAQNDASATVARASSTSSAAAQTHTIAVGLADHKFIPDVTKAAIGDVSTNPISPSLCLPKTLVAHKPNCSPYVTSTNTTTDRRVPLLPRKPQRRPRRIRHALHPLRNDRVQENRLLLGLQRSRQGA
jgi:hypothetical protein